MKSIRHICACIFRLKYSHCFMKYTQQSHQKSPSTGAYYHPIRMCIPHISSKATVTYRKEFRKMFIVLYDFSFLHQPVYRFIQSSGSVYDRPPVLTGNVIWKKLVATSPFPIQDLFPIRNPWRLSFNGFYMQKCSFGFMLQILWVIWGGAVA